MLLLLQPNTTEHLILNPGSVHAVTVDNLPHLVPTTFGHFVKKQNNDFIFERTHGQTSEEV